MPEPNPGESRKEFVNRCIRVVIEEGTAKDADQAVAICNSMWEQKHKMSEYELNLIAVMNPYK